MDLFKPLQVLDESLRRDATRSVIDLLHMLEREQRPLLLSTVPSMVRLSLECPFEDVRNSIDAYLLHLHEDLLITWSPHIPPSTFIPESLV